MTLYRKAIGEMRSLLRQAQRQHRQEPVAMTLATASSNRQPSTRTVLLKGVSNQGFVFFTNTNSRKGRQLADNPRAALCFFFDSLDRQVNVEGRVHRVSDKEADAYWNTRPRQSQLGAWASQQSSPLKNRAALLKRAAQFAKKYKGKNVPRPPYWTGFCVLPNRIEFWKRGAYRLHHRLAYEKKGGRWTVALLNP